MLWHCPSWNPMEFEAVALLFCLRQTPIPRTHQWRCFPKCRSISFAISSDRPLSNGSLHRRHLWAAPNYSGDLASPLICECNYFPGKHGSDDPSLPDLDQLCQEDRWQTHTGSEHLPSHLYFYKVILAYTDSHRPQVQADQEEALQVLDLKLGARMMKAASVWYFRFRFGNFDMPDWWSQLSRNTLSWA